MPEWLDIGQVEKIKFINSANIKKLMANIDR